MGVFYLTLWEKCCVNVNSINYNIIIQMWYCINIDILPIILYQHLSIYIRDNDLCLFFNKKIKQNYLWFVSTLRHTFFFWTHYVYWLYLSYIIVWLHHNSSWISQYAISLIRSIRFKENVERDFPNRYECFVNFKVILYHVKYPLILVHFLQQSEKLKFSSH